MRVLASVDRKDELVDFAQGLAARRHTFVAGGNTARLLESNGIRCAPYRAARLLPEVGGVRYRLVRKRVVAAIRADREDRSHMRSLCWRLIKPIHVVVCNLRPPTKGIDIGGLTLIATAAENWRHVVVLVNPDDYGEVLDELRRNGRVSDRTRLRLAIVASRYITDYTRTAYCEVAATILLTD